MIYDPAGKQPIIDTRSTVLGGQTAIQQPAKMPTSANEATQQQQPQAQNQGASGAPTTPTTTTTQQPQQPPKLRTASVPPAISPDIAGAPHARQKVIQSPDYNRKSQTTPVDAGQQVSDEDAASGGHKLPDQLKVSNYDDLIRYYENKMREVEPLSKEELEKIRRRQRAEGIVSGVSDAVRSIANIVAAHNYAPVFTDSNASMSARARARFDREKAEREAKDQEYFNYAMNIARLKDADRDQAFNIWKTEHALDREDVEDKYREAKENREQAKADRDAIKAALHNQYMMGKISAQDYAAQIKEVELKYADALQQSKINKNNQRPVRGGGSKSGGKGRPAEHWYYDENDNKVYVHSAAAAKQGAIASNTYKPIYQEVETVTDNLIGGTKVGEKRRKTKRQTGWKSEPKGKKKGWASDLKL
ncbi:MAG: hypothetical protein ACI305_07395 [Lepagella sp.]